MNYYEILGVDKTATQDEIRKAFRKKAMEQHPDRGGDESKFKELNEAHEVLSDETKRRQYDQFGSGGNPFGGFNGGGRYQTHGFSMDDIFSQFGDFFGGGRSRQQRQRKGNDLRVQLTISLEDVILGTNRKVKYNRQKPCDPCGGKGGSESKTCLSCNGTGQRTVTQQTPFGIVSQTAPCNNCNSSGKVISNPCKSCKGEGTTLNEEIVDIEIPKGVSGGMTLTMSGFGNHVRDGIPGDLHIVIEEIRHPKFRREDFDLHCEEWITIPDAVLGCEIKIDTITEQLNLNIPQGCESGKIFRFNGKGVPIVMENGRTNGMGHLYVKVNVKIPKDISREEQSHYIELKNLQTK